MAKYEFTIVTEVEPYTHDNIDADLSRFFKPLTEQGVTFHVTTYESVSGGHPDVEVEGDPALIREHMKVSGWNDTDEEFEELYRMDD